MPSVGEPFSPLTSISIVGTPAKRILHPDLDSAEELKYNSQVCIYCGEKLIDVYADAEVTLPGTQQIIDYYLMYCSQCEITFKVVWYL